MKRFAFLAFILLFLVSLTACGKEEPIVDITDGDITITVQPVAFLDYYTKLAIEKYETEHANVKFEILDPIEWGAIDIGMSKVYTDISNGAGPDIIIADKDALSILLDKKCLLDISDAISEETKDVLINPVKNVKYDDGKMYLAPGNMNTSLMFVSGSNISGDSWTISDFVSVIEQKEKAGTPYEWIAVRKGQPCVSMDVFQLFMECMDAASFIDWDKKTCSFDSPEFIKVLELSKKYNDYAKEHSPSANDLKEEVNLLKEGKALILYDQIPSLISYSEIKAFLGSDYKEIGAPCDNGSGKRAIFGTNLSVNKNTKYRTVIKGFIDYYYSLENCIRCNYEIRTDIYDGRIVYDKELESYGIKYKLDDGATATSILTVKPDGSDYTNEYFDLLNTFECEDLKNSREVAAIKDIIYDEAEYFFSGNKSAEEVASLIQSRVSLLLVE